MHLFFSVIVVVTEKCNISDVHMQTHNSFVSVYGNVISDVSVSTIGRRKTKVKG